MKNPAACTPEDTARTYKEILAMFRSSSALACVSDAPEKALERISSLSKKCKDIRFGPETIRTALEAVALAPYMSQDLKKAIGEALRKAASMPQKGGQAS